MPISELVVKSGSRPGRRVLTEVICESINGMPTMTLFLQALMANMARAFEHRTIWPPWSIAQQVYNLFQI